MDPYPFAPVDGEREPARRRSPRRTLLVGASIAVAVAVLGAPLGLLWHVLAPGVPVIDAGASGIVVNDPSPEEYIAAEGWFTVLGFAFGLAVAIAAWLVLRRHRGPALLLGVIVGSLGASLVAWRLGRLIGLGAYERWRDTATSGATYHAPPDLHAYGVLLVSAFAAAIVLTLMAGWSNDPDLDRPGALPGYGNNAGAPAPGSFGSAAPDPLGAGPISSGSPGGPDPTAAPGPPAPGTAVRPHE